jgi:multiple sugar transport system permease protein
MRSAYPLRKRLGTVLLYAMLILLGAIILLPLGWMVTAALKPDDVTVFNMPPQWLPREYWQWKNFSRVMHMETRPFGLYMQNTLTIVAGNVIGNLFCCSLAAFAFARLQFRGKAILFNFLIVTMLIPWQVLMIPQFLMFNSIGWYGTFLPLIVPSYFGNVTSAFYIFLITQYMRSFPKELEDAARIDGCNHWQVFRYIILPLSTPVLVVVAVFVFLNSWNDLMGPLIYLNDNSQFTVSLGLANFVVSRTRTPWNLLMAANLVTMLPAIIMYFFSQKKLVGGIATVGLKG